jgi:hypothetical protein
VWKQVVDEIDDLVRRIVPTLGTVARTKPRQ